jgi:predicted HicB family RNase H-like nuclease
MAKLMQYQGYYGSADPSPEDGCLYGKLEFISALVSYEANTVPKLVKAFHFAVDDYLATCKQLDQEPEKPCKGVFNVRVGHELHAKAAVIAKERGIKLNEFTRQALEEKIGRSG